MVRMNQEGLEHILPYLKKEGKDMTKVDEEVVLQGESHRKDMLDLHERESVGIKSGSIENQMLLIRPDQFSDIFMFMEERVLPDEEGGKTEIETLHEYFRDNEGEWDLFTQEVEILVREFIFQTKDHLMDPARLGRLYGYVTRIARERFIKNEIAQH